MGTKIGGPDRERGARRRVAEAAACHQVAKYKDKHGFPIGGDGREAHCTEAAVCYHGRSQHMLGKMRKAPLFIREGPNT